MEVFYNGNLIKDNEFLKLTDTQIEPQIKLNVNPNSLYTLIVYDPDAIVGNYIHWIIVNITNNDIKTGNILIPYKGPSPPPKTGKHHYIFELYKQNRENKLVNITERTMPINLLRNKLEISIPIYITKFISENKNGGKKTKTKIKKNKKTRKNKKY